MNPVRGWAAAVLLALALVGGCTSPGPAPSGPVRAAAASIRPQPGPSPRPTPEVAAVPGDGALPQTAASPVASGPVFETEMAALWQAVVSGDAGTSSPAFFPLAAYLQVKTVRDPAADWRNRLFGGFAADVAAAHVLVSATGSDATLVGVAVPAGDARWIRPGSCANRLGYWHVAGARLVYRSAGVVRSFGIASLISWRGTWYVVHLGAVLRRGAAGVVDRPATGVGTPGPPGGC